MGDGKDAGVFIATATAADLEALGTLGRETYLAFFADIWTPSELETYLHQQYGSERLQADLADPAVSYHCVSDRERMLGFAKVVRARPVPGGLVETGTELQKLYVRREVTGRGLGARLLERVLDEARSEGAALVWLDVLRSNAGARRMYERHGFQVVAELPFATGRGEIGFWVMARRLQG